MIVVAVVGLAGTTGLVFSEVELEKPNTLTVGSWTGTYLAFVPMCGLIFAWGIPRIRIAATGRSEEFVD